MEALNNWNAFTSRLIVSFSYITTISLKPGLPQIPFRDHCKTSWLYSLYSLYYLCLIKFPSSWNQIWSDLWHCLFYLVQSLRFLRSLRSLTINNIYFGQLKPLDLAERILDVVLTMPEIQLAWTEILNWNFDVVEQTSANGHQNSIPTWSKYLASLRVVVFSGRTRETLSSDIHAMVPRH